MVYTTTFRYFIRAERYTRTFTGNNLTGYSRYSIAAGGSHIYLLCVLAHVCPSVLEKKAAATPTTLEYTLATHGRSLQNCKCQPTFGGTRAFDACCW